MENWAELDPIGLNISLVVLCFEFYLLQGASISSLSWVLFFSAVAWCGKLNAIACASETCARIPRLAFIYL